MQDFLFRHSFLQHTGIFHVRLQFGPGKRIRPKENNLPKMGNPFADGTCRMISTERKKKKNKDQAFAEWVPTLPELEHTLFMFLIRHYPTA